MNHLHIAFSHDALQDFEDCITRFAVTLDETDFSDVAAIVITDADHEEVLSNPLIEALRIPVFLIKKDPNTTVKPEFVGKITRVIDGNEVNYELYVKQIEAAAKKYEEEMLPPFFRALADYVEDGNSQFDCPGHQGGQFFARHPAGRAFYDFYGENLFRSDLCNADVKLGDLLIHEGPACDAQQHAAQVYNADKTYFVLNGTSSANKMVLNALLAPGDIILYDRNNHKSISHGALVQAGATPVYLETARNPYGTIAGKLEHGLNEE